MKTNVLSEHQESVLVAQYLRLLQNQGKVIIFTKICQETWTRSWSQKTKNKQEGLNKGFPDYAIIVKDNYDQNILVFIELKKTKGGVVSREQKEWADALNEAGEYHFFCKGFDEVKKIIDKLIKGL